LLRAGVRIVQTERRKTNGKRGKVLRLTPVPPLVPENAEKVLENAGNGR
jgi:hypothetical protein